jgi:hypothetical protein
MVLFLKNGNFFCWSGFLLVLLHTPPYRRDLKGFNLKKEGR